MAYNLDVFENLVFKVPSEEKIRLILSGLGITYGLVVFMVGYFTVPGIGGLDALGVCIASFLFPPFLTAILTRRFPAFPRRWGYLLGLVAATFSVCFLLVEFLLGISEEWRVLTFGSAALLLTLLAILVLTASTERPALFVLTSVPMPITLLFIPVLWRNWYDLPMLDTTQAVAALGGVSLGLAASVFIHERIFDANVSYINGSQLTSTLLTEQERDIDTGYPHRPRVQSLAIEPGRADRDTFFLVSPWVHPGPLVNFGGGSVAQNIIQGLNNNGSGFFAKIPCTHEEDPTEVAVAERILNAVPDPDVTDQASKLLHCEYDSITFYGRRYGDKKVVFIEPDDFGDFPPSIFAERIDPSDTLIIDRHAYEADDERGIRYGSVGAKQLRDTLDSFLADLSDQPLGEYKAGTAVDTTGKQICALVECVDGQRTVLFGSNENEVSETIYDVCSDTESRFDHTVFFSTDTHHDMHDLAARSQVKERRIRSVIEAADQSVETARAGIDVARAEEPRLLGTEYYALMYSINYVLRSFTVSLAVLYAFAALVLFV